MQSFIIRNNNSIGYEIYGGGERTLLLIHDIGSSSKSLENLVNFLAKQVKVVTIDLCGHGGSSLPKSMVSIKSMAKDVLEVLDKAYLGRCRVVAVGCGGAVALEAFNYAPEFFVDFVFISTILTPQVRTFLGEGIRPTDFSEKDKEFRDIFKRWVPAYRDDFFYLCSKL